MSEINIQPINLSGLSKGIQESTDMLNFRSESNQTVILLLLLLLLWQDVRRCAALLVLLHTAASLFFSGSWKHPAGRWSSCCPPCRTLIPVGNGLVTPVQSESSNHNLTCHLTHNWAEKSSVLPQNESLYLRRLSAMVHAHVSTGAWNRQTLTAQRDCQGG